MFQVCLVSNYTCSLDPDSIINFNNDKSIDVRKHKDVSENNERANQKDIDKYVNGICGGKGPVGVFSSPLCTGTFDI